MSMTVAELIDKLSTFDGNLPVRIETGEDAVEHEIDEVSLDDDTVEVVLACTISGT